MLALRRYPASASTPSRPSACVPVLGSLLILAFLALPVLAQDSLLISGGTVHTLAGESFVGDVLISSGRIQAVGSAAEVAAASSDARRLDASGLHVYPGLFDALGQIGLVEVGSIAATIDSTEQGAFLPHLRAATAVHPASALFGVTREVGITHALSAPRSQRDGVIAGQAALINLQGWTVEEMALDPAIAMVVQWPELRTVDFDFSTFSRVDVPFREAKEKAEEGVEQLREWLTAARHYGQAVASGRTRTPRNLKLEALSAVVAAGDEQQKVIVIAESKRDIEAAVEFAEEEGLDMILAGGREAWEVAEVLAEKQIPVILGRVQTLPRQEDDPYELPFRNAGKLVAAGVQIAFGSGASGGFGGSPHSARNLPLEAGTAVANGLDHVAALRALTINPAEMLGFGDQLGTVEPGKRANLMITDGDPLEIATRVHHLIIDGHEVSTDNRHRQLYEKFRARPRAE